MAGELGAVVVCDAPARRGRQRREYAQLGDDGAGRALVGDDAGLEVSGPAFDLGVQVAADADDAVRLPVAELPAVAGACRAMPDAHA